jgi:hypothetical protein
VSGRPASRSSSTTEDFASIAGVGKEETPTPLYTAAIALIFVGTFAFFAVLLRLE